MTINSFVLKGDLNDKIVVVRFFFCRVYIFSQIFVVVRCWVLYMSNANATALKNKMLGIHWFSDSKANQVKFRKKSLYIVSKTVLKYHPTYSITPLPYLDKSLKVHEREFLSKNSGAVAQNFLSLIVISDGNIEFVCLFDSLRPINNLSVKQGRVFLGWTSTKLGLMCLAQGP